MRSAWFISSCFRWPPEPRHFSRSRCVPLGSYLPAFGGRLTLQLGFQFAPAPHAILGMVVLALFQLRTIEEQELPTQRTAIPEVVPLRGIVQVRPALRSLRVRLAF